MTEDIFISNLLPSIITCLQSCMQTMSCLLSAKLKIIGRNISTPLTKRGFNLTLVDRKHLCNRVHERRPRRKKPNLMEVPINSETRSGSLWDLQLFNHRLFFSSHSSFKFFAVLLNDSLVPAPCIFSIEKVPNELILHL